MSRDTDRALEEGQNSMLRSVREARAERDQARQELAALRSASQGAGGDLIDALLSSVGCEPRWVGSRARCDQAIAARAALEARILEGDRAREAVARVLKWCEDQGCIDDGDDVCGFEGAAPLHAEHCPGHVESLLRGDS